MEELVIANKSDLVAVADAVRQLKGTSDGLTINEMKINIDDTHADITAALSALAEKGVDVPAGSTSDALAGLIEAIEAGGGDIAYGTIIPASTGKSVAITHNLGVVPTVGVWVKVLGRDESSTSDVYALYQDASKNGNRVHTWQSSYYSDDTGGGRSLTQTVQSYYFNSATESVVYTPKYVISGKEYFWMVMK